MRRQNPPQVSLDQAQSIEKYFNPATIATLYIFCATLYCGFISSLFAVLVHDYIINPTLTAIGSFSVIALAPTVWVFFACIRRPDDPLSRTIKKFSEARRNPIEVVADRCTFKVLLKSGETLCINFSFHYPGRYRSPELSDRLNTYIHAALEQDCSIRTQMPTESEIEAAADCALEVLAAQYDIPVLYLQIRDVHKIRDSYSSAGDLAPSEYLGTTAVVGTGTFG